MKNKQVLLVSNYFPPEKGAASNRLYAMVKELAKNNYTVQVVCPLPNYPHGVIFDAFKTKRYYKSQEEFGWIHRLWIWPSNSSNKFIRVFSMLSFSISLSWFFLFTKTPKTVIIQYSPVFVGFTAMLWAKILRKKVILNISDLWPLAGLEMGILKKGFYYSLLTKMENYCYSRAHIILGQSQEILDHIIKRGIHKPLFLYRNFPDFDSPPVAEKPQENSIKIVYAGLLGVAQGLYAICKSIELPPDISLHIYGTGPEAEAIQSLSKKNIHYHGEIARTLLHSELQNYDLGFIPLVNRIYGSVPSKIFEQSRLGLPLLYFAGGEGEVLVRNHKLGWTVPSGDLKALQEFITSLSRNKLEEFSKNQVRENAITSFDLEKQFKALIEVIEAN